MKRARRKKRKKKKKKRKMKMKCIEKSNLKFSVEGDESLVIKGATVCAIDGVGRDKSEHVELSDRDLDLY